MRSQNNSNSASTFQLRIIVVAVFIFLLFSVIVARVTKLQVYDYEYFHTRATNNHIKLIPTGAVRGRIYDRQMQLIAEQYTDFDLIYYPDESKLSKIKLIALLEKLINLSEREKKNFEGNVNNVRGAPLVIRNQLSNEDIAKISSLSFLATGLEIEPRSTRIYPKKEIAATITGYVGNISPEEQESLTKSGEIQEYYGINTIGKVGLEKHYEKFLRGKPGNKKIETTATGMMVRTIEENPSTPGNDLITTIDMDFQEKIYNLLGDYNGAVVALDPNNGDVLALVSKKTYDPNVFIGVGGKERVDLFNDYNFPLINRAIASGYPPASTFKPFVGLAGLENNKRTLTEQIFCPGYFSLPGSTHRYRDWNRGGHGLTDYHKSLVRSVDTYYYSLAVNTGIDILNSYISQFSYGKLTGIDTTGEKSALLPSPEWKKARYNDDWRPGDTVSFGIGQGYMLATPLQLAVGYSVIANHGFAYRPRLVKEIRDPITNKIREIPPEKNINLNINEEFIDATIKALIGVNAPGGTAARAFSGTKYISAGKTGTAQVISIAQDKTYRKNELKKEYHDHALYVGFAPANNPKIVVATVIENAGGGSANAAPIVRKIFDEYLNN